MMRPNLMFGQRISSRTDNRERGSAYVLSLLVLLVLSLLGLSLAVTTSTEMQIGANEELIEQSLFAGDAGLSIAVAARLVRAHTRQETFRLTTDQFVDETPVTQVEADIDSGCIVSLSACNGCEVTIGNDTNGELFYRELSVVVNTGRVVGTRTLTSDSTPIVSRRLVTGILDVQPIKSAGIEALALSTPERCIGARGTVVGTPDPLDSMEQGERGCDLNDPCPI